jgi:hypothetical protein
MNEDINFVCKDQKSEYLKAIALTFCVADYEAGVKCQNAAGADWASKCFQENVRFGQCADGSLKRLYIYNLEHHKKNPNAV